MIKKIDESKKELEYVLRSSILRDIIGFAPMYSITFTLILWMTALYHQGDSGSFFNLSLFSIPIWLWIASCFVLDQVENIIHLYQLKRYVNSAENSVNDLVAPFASLISLIKTIIFILLSVK